MSIVWSTQYGYEAVVRGDYLEQQWINRYHLICQVVSDPTESVTAFVTALQSVWLSAAQAVQNTAVVYRDVLVTNRGVPSQGTFNVVNFQQGDIASTILTQSPSWAALTLRLTTSQGIRRSGYKRLPGLIDSNIAGNSLDDPTETWFPLLNTLCGALETPFSTAGGNVFALGVLTHNNPDASNVYPVVSVTYNSLVGTQNTRKVRSGD